MSTNHIELLNQFDEANGSTLCLSRSFLLCHRHSHSSKFFTSDIFTFFGHADCPFTYWRPKYAQSVFWILLLLFLFHCSVSLTQCTVLVLLIAASVASVASLFNTYPNFIARSYINAPCTYTHRIIMLFILIESCLKRIIELRQRVFKASLRFFVWWTIFRMFLVPFQQKKIPTALPHWTDDKLEIDWNDGKFVLFKRFSLLFSCILIFFLKCLSIFFIWKSLFSEFFFLLSIDFYWCFLQ